MSMRYSLLAAILIVSLICSNRSASADRPDPSFRCSYGPDGNCAPKSNTYGFYQTRWRRWPGPGPEMQIIEDVKAPPRPVTRVKPSAEADADKPPKEFIVPKDDRPQFETPPQDLLPEPAPPNKSQPRALDDDLPPVPPPAEVPAPLQPPSQAAPAGPLERERPAMPTEPNTNLPQPGLEQDLRNLLPEERPASPLRKGPTKPRKPPAGDLFQEDPFRDDSVPGETPATPKTSQRVPRWGNAIPEKVARPGQGPSQMQWRTGGPQASQPTLRPAGENLRLRPDTRSLEPAEVRVSDRQTSWETPTEGAANPLRDAPRPQLRRTAPEDVVPAAGWDTDAPAAVTAGGPWSGNPLRLR
jgi:hypothetical protein